MSAPSTITRRAALQRITVLLGGTLSGPTLAALLTACERAPRASTEAGFTAEQNELLATIAEHIIPQTDTPGARATGVHEFIAEMMTRYYPPEERQIFMVGLGEVDGRARQAHDRTFLQCTPEQQLAILTTLDQESFTPRPPPEPPTEQEARARAQPGTAGTPLPPQVATDTIAWEVDIPQPRRAETPFWRTMKELTLVGYYTSRAGATEELRHEPVPGRFDGCVPLAQIGRAWAV